MKKFLYIISAALTLSLTGCKDFLVEENLASTTADAYYRTAAGMNAAVNVAYSYLRDVYREPTPFLAGTDLHIVYKGRDGADQPLATYQSLSPSNSGTFNLSDFYNFLYKGVGAANTALHYSELTEQTADLPRLTAEARFLRAYYYMHLVQQFGGTPLVTVMNESPVLELERASEQDVWNFIITEMEAALPNLMDRAAAATWGRVDKRACNHFLALAYLTRGWKAYGGGQADFTKAKSYADAAIGTMTALSLPYARAYSALDYQWRNDEVVWCVEYHANSMETTTTGSNQGSYFGGYMDGAPQGNKQIVHKFTITQYGMWLTTKDIGDPNKDTRWDAQYEMVTYKTSFLAYTDSPLAYNPAAAKATADVNGVWIPWWKPEYTRWKTRADFAKEYPGTTKSGGFADKAADAKVYPVGRFRHMHDAGIDFTTATQAQLNTANAVILSDTDPEGALAKVSPANLLVPNFIKFDSYPQQKTNLNTRSSVRDIDLARIAETYLIAAEACIKLGDQASAAEYINRVRRRAIDASDPKREITSAQATIDFVLEERARELFGQYIRWYDLARTGTLVERAVRYNPDLDGNPDYFKGPDGNQKLLRPIPQSAIDANRANIQQNPGY